MKHILISFVGACCISLLVTGCAPVGNLYVDTVTSSAFTPPQGRALNPQENSAGERRLLIATSTDGIRFTPTGAILTDQGNVPDALIDAQGNIVVYYVGQSIEQGKEENTVRAVSQDNGETWEFQELTFKNFTQPRDPADPDVVLLDNGTYRMYYTSNTSKGSLGILYADSSDGVTFTHKGTALTDSLGVIDSTTSFFNGMWHMYVLEERGGGQLYATSTDGKTFQFASQKQLRFPLEKYIASNALSEGNEVRMFAFSLPEKNIRSFTTHDMETWTSSDVALTGDSATTLGSLYIQDSTTVQLANGTYLMIYVSEILE